MQLNKTPKLSISAWVWTSTPEENNFDFINKAASIGYQGVEIPTFTGDINKKSLGETISSVSKKMYPIIVGGGSRQMDLTSNNLQNRKNAYRYIEKLIELCEFVDSELICGPLYAPVGKLKLISDHLRNKILDRVASSFKTLSNKLEDSGIKIALEPLCRYDTYLINTVDQAIELISRINSDNFGILIDTFHTNIEEESISKAFEISGKKTYHIQVCENNRGIPGSGQINWKEVKKSLKLFNYDKWISVESFTPYDDKFSEKMRMWRKFSPDQDFFAKESYSFLKHLLSE